MAACWRSTWRLRELPRVHPRRSVLVAGCATWLQARSPLLFARATLAEGVARAAAERDWWRVRVQGCELGCLPHSEKAAIRGFRVACAAMAMESVEEVKGSAGGCHVAVLTLDRPKALNAMSLEMDLAYMSLLEEWEKRPEVKAVLVEGSTSRAFCSGGDVKWMTTTGKQQLGLPHVAEKVFTAEYKLICKIANFQKPYISIMDGITMGFGIGLSCHGCYRVITERTTLAMPENGIGLFPDIGFAYLAAKTPGKGALGAYMALCGARIGSPADALFSGLATHFVPSQDIPSLRAALLNADLTEDSYAAIENVLERFAKQPEGESKLKALLPVIEKAFSKEKTLPEVILYLTELRDSKDTAVAVWAEEALQGIAKGGPFSLAVTKRHFDAVADEEGRNTVAAVMRTEYRLARRISCRGDFVEGVRAVLVDKDQKPQWQPPTLEEVDPKDVEAVFAALEGESELMV